MKRVVHLGPSESKGGMATVIQNMVKNSPEGWSAEAIPTHSDNSIRSISRWINASKKLSSELSKGTYDLVHIHVTHSLSWWRKLSFMKKCEKFRVPMIIHIHSGKFDSFCSGFSGSSVEKALSKRGRKILVLEERWLERLKNWIPGDSEVVRNFSSPVSRSINHVPSEKLRLLVLSRKSSVKGHDFAVQVAKCIGKMGREVTLTITGGPRFENVIFGNLEVKKYGWVTLEERKSLLSESDFLLSPSKFEGSSMSIIESMVSGLPCLASEASRETIGIEELIIRDLNPDKWAKRILEICEKEAYRKVVDSILINAEKYNSEVNRIKIGEIYEDLLGSNHGD